MRFAWKSSECGCARGTSTTRTRASCCLFDKVTAVDGTIDGLSNDPSRRAAVNAGGTVAPYGSASVQGTILPFDAARYTDLHVVFENVLMPPLSPYTATFAGRAIDSGRLWLDLEYKIADGQLVGKNDVRLADFTLGERVKAPGRSTSLSISRSRC